MINSVILTGRLTKNIDLRQTSAGKAMTYFTLAVNRVFKNEQGVSGADFVTCVAFGVQAENMAGYLTQGSLIGVEGRISTRNFQGKDGNTVYVTEVIASNATFLESKKQQTNINQQFEMQSYQQQSNSNFNAANVGIDFSDLENVVNPFHER